MNRHYLSKEEGYLFPQPGKQLQMLRPMVRRCIVLQWTKRWLVEMECRKQDREVRGNKTWINKIHSHIGEEGERGLSNSQASDLSSRAHNSAICELGNTGAHLKWGERDLRHPSEDARQLNMEVQCSKERSGLEICICVWRHICANPTKEMGAST